MYPKFCLIDISLNISEILIYISFVFSLSLSQNSVGGIVVAAVAGSAIALGAGYVVWRNVSAGQVPDLMAVDANVPIDAGAQGNPIFDGPSMEGTNTLYEGGPEQV